MTSCGPPFPPGTLTTSTWPAPRSGLVTAAEPSRFFVLGRPAFLTFMACATSDRGDGWPHGGGVVVVPRARLAPPLLAGRAANARYSAATQTAPTHPAAVRIRQL